jgi:16S rRNA (adenine1518-N6/adenine1519-N6)-dimethyltransferase
MTPRPLLTPTEVRRLLDVHGLAPRKAFGQNFVVDANTVRKVVRDAEVAAGDLVVEVGPGLGSLTLALREAGARVRAVEIDAGMVRALAEVVGEDPGVEIVHADALAVDWAALLADEDAVLVANLPYNVGTHIVMGCLESGAPFSRMLVMVQREVGRRWAAGVGDPLYAAISVKLAALADVRIAAAVKRGAFHPVPNVESVTVRIDPRPWALPVPREVLFGLVEAGFSQRRKRLRNALSRLAAPADVEAALTAAGLDPGARAEELDLAAWGALAAVFPTSGA